MTKEERNSQIEEKEIVSTKIEIIQEIKEEVEVESRVKMLDATHLVIEEREYELIKDYRDAFDADRFGERFSDILGKYDYIVADWGFDQLRLKGFYEDKNQRAPLDQRISTLEDYIYEYCNFGCAYFVLKRTGGKKEPINRPKKSRPYRDKNRKPVAQNQEKAKGQQKKNNFTVKKTEAKQPVKSKQVAQSNQPNKRHFNIQKNDTK